MKGQLKDICRGLGTIKSNTASLKKKTTNRNSGKKYIIEMKTLMSGLNNKLRRAKDRHGLQEDSFEKNDLERPKEDIIKNKD